MKKILTSLFKTKEDSGIFENIFFGITIFLAPIAFLLMKLSGIASVQGLVFTGMVWLGLLCILLLVVLRGKFILPRKYSSYSILTLIIYTIFQVVAFSSVYFSFGTTPSFIDHPLFFVSLLVFVAIISLLSRGYSFLRQCLFLLGVIMSFVIFHTLLVGISGWEFLSLGFATSGGMNIFGSWVDLSIISFLLLVSSFVYSFFSENSFQRKAMWIFGIIGMSGMIVTNIYLIWVLLGLFSLGSIFIAFFHAQNNLQSLLHKKTAPLVPVFLFLISLVFIIGNSFISEPIRSFSGVQTQEIRLSASTTYDIVSKLPVSQIIVGSGLGTFEQIWFKNLDPQVLQTPLWNTGFSFAFGYLPTFLITFGIIGLLFIILFFVSVIFEGYQSLIHVKKEDRGIVSLLYVVTLFSLPLMIFAIPGLFVLVLLFTGIGLLLGFSHVSSAGSHEFDVFAFQSIWKRFVAVGIVLLFVAACVYVLFAHARYFGSLRMVQKSILGLNDNNPELAMNYLYRAQSYTGNNYDSHMMIAQTAFTILQSSNQEKITQESVQNILQLSLASLQKSVNIQPKKYQPYVLLGDFHMFLYTAGLKEALPVAMESYQKSLDFRPYNPYILLVQAEELFNQNAVDEGRQKLDELFKLHSFNPSFFQEAGLLEEKFGSLIRAEAYLKQAIFLNRNQLDTWMQLISFYSRTGSLDKAQEALEFLVTTYPENINIRILAARFFSETGHTSSAQEHIDFLKKYQESIPQLKEFLIDLQNGVSVIPEIIESDELLEDSEDTNDNQITESEL